MHVPVLQSAVLVLYFYLRNLRNLRMILLTYNRNDCQVSANRAEFGQRGEPER